MAHRQILLRDGGQEAEIDEGLVPIIRALWRRGARTEECCQGCRGRPQYGSHERAYISFSDAESVRTFVNAVAIYDEEARKDEASGLLRRRGVSRVKSIYWRATLPRTEESAFDNLLPGGRCWRYEFDVLDASDASLSDHALPLGHAPDFQISTCIWFPSDDIPLITKRLLNTEKK